ncbi:MAG: hypothetical protein LQ341_006727 [Variospora aurantia]|nr:MAG: hypothetical protein LQ341_006727 [Variospora aurantia]
MVDKLIHYLYNFDYDDTGFFEEDEEEDHHNLSLAAIKEGEEETGTAEAMDEKAGQEGKGNVDEGADWGSYEGDRNEGGQKESESQLLVLNAGMYIIGDRFDLSHLKDLAEEKFSAALIDRWDKEDLPGVIRTIYDNTMPSNRPLRDRLVPVLIQHKKALRENEDFMDLVKTHGDFAVSLVDAWGQAQKIQLGSRSRAGSMYYNDVGRNYTTQGHDGVVTCPSCDAGLSYSQL